MTGLQIDELANSWIADGGDGKSFETLWDLCREEPENAWLVIQKIAVQELSEDLESLLAAGPIEDLLAKHGDAFIDRVEAKAKNDSKFNHLLGGVWKSEMTENIWRRVQLIRKKVW